MTRKAVKAPGRRGRLRLSEVPLDRGLDKRAYEKRLAALQLELRRIQQAYLAGGERGIVVFEGWDAAGKGGTIRRMSSVLDPRGFKVWPIAAPSDAEKAQHFLHRFWERLPPRGAVAVFDRSWYGRVLVERVEKLATRAEWSRAYRDIVEFERMLADDGARLVKIFLHVSPDEQLRRFEQRLADPLKRWKLTYEDFRNRDLRPLYEAAVEEMVARTSTAAAPWHVIPAEDKKYARVEAIARIVETLAEGVDLSPRPLDEEAKAMARAVFGSLPKDL
jgi:AMP-polyphosphate phosphotransferase